MLAVFGKQRMLGSPPGSPLSPTGTKRRHEENQSLTPEEETYVSGVLDQIYTSLPRRQHAYLNEHYFGGGANGLAWVECLTQGLFSDGEVSAFFMGQLENNTADVEDAEYIVQLYRKSCGIQGLDSLAAAAGNGGDSGLVTEILSQLRGPFAFLLYDRGHGRIVAARDAAGEQPLYWGTTLLSEGVLFASDKSLIDAECCDADCFPPGAVFVSQDFSTVGSLTPLSLDDTAAEQQQAQEVLCRVESSSQLHKVSSQSHIEAN